ncbi:MAG: hypothetical protein U0169_16550 [Polyangiaceae bacterium]
MRIRRLSLGFGLVMIVAGAMGCGAAADDHVAGSTESANSITDQIRRIRMGRFKESLAPVMRSVINDPTDIGRSVRTAIEDSERVIFNTELPRDAPVNQVRKAVAALGKTKATRRMMVKNSLQALERRSSKLKELIATSMDFQGAVVDRSNWFDELVIGTGPQGVAYMQAATDASPFKRIVAVETGSKPGGTFANVNEAFALNSTNRANTGTRAKPGEGDLNFVQDVWGLPDFEGQKWVPAGGLGDLSTVGTDLASADVLLQTKVTKVLDKFKEPNSEIWPARYLVEVTDEATGKVNKLFTDKIVVASGIGKPVVPIKDESTLKLIAEEAGRVDLNPDEIPGIQTFTDVVNRIGQTETPYRWAVGKDVVVAGGGDSGKVINEFLFRLAPEGSYGQDVAQVGNVKRVFWLGVSFEDCKQYIAQSRARYSRLAAAINSGELVPVPGKIVSIARGEGEGAKGFKLVYQTPEGEIITNGIKYNKPPARVAGGAEGDLAAAANPETALLETPVDNIILATGFKSEAEEVFAGIIKPGEGESRPLGELLDPLVGRPDGFDGDVNYATRLRTNNDRVAPQDIFFVGPSNEVRGGLPRPDELAGVNANTVSLFANVNRTRLLARFNAATPARGLGPISEILNLPTIAQLGRNRLPTARTPIPVARLDATKPLMNLSSIADIELKVQVAKLMQRFEMPEGMNMTISVTKSAEGTLGVRIPDLDFESEKILAYSLVQQNKELGEMLFGYFGKGSGVKRLEIVVPTVNERTSTVRETAIEVVRRFN